MRITRRRRAGISTVVTALAGLALLASPATAASAAPQLSNYGQLTCSSGFIEPGVYISILVIGNCSLTDFGTVIVNGDLRVADDASFNAVTGGTLIVDGSFYSGSYSDTDIGCNVKLKNSGCTSNSNDVIWGNVYSDNALEMSFNNVQVGGWYEAVTAGDAYPNNTTCQLQDSNGNAGFMAFANGSVGGSFTWLHMHTCWMSLSNNKIGGNVHITGNRTGSKPTIGSNWIGGGLWCVRNQPGPVLGNNLKNQAKHGKYGQCAKL
jgi:hypothetical protein